MKKVNINWEEGVWVYLKVIVVALYLFGGAFIYPGMLHQLLGRGKRGLAISGIYYLVIVPLAWICVFTVVGIVCTPFLYLGVWILPAYDAYLIWKGRPALFEKVK